MNFEKGKLKAVGYINGKQVEDIRTTPTKPVRLKLTINELLKKWKSNGDLLFVYAHITDENGTLCSGETSPIQLTLSGDAKIIGPSQVKAEAGIASFFIQSGVKSGKVEAEAKGGNLSGKIVVVVE